MQNYYLLYTEKLSHYKQNVKDVIEESNNRWKMCPSDFALVIEHWNIEPLSRINDTLEIFTWFKQFLILYLRSDYWQASIYPKDPKKLHSLLVMVFSNSRLDNIMHLLCLTVSSNSWLEVEHGKMVSSTLSIYGGNVWRTSVKYARGLYQIQKCLTPKLCQEVYPVSEKGEFLILM